MGNPHRYYGKATVKADGQAYEMKDVEFTPSGIKREDVLDGKGFSETEQGGSVKEALEVLRLGFIPWEGEQTLLQSSFVHSLAFNGLTMRLITQDCGAKNIRG